MSEIVTMSICRPPADTAATSRPRPAWSRFVTPARDPPGPTRRARITRQSDPAHLWRARFSYLYSVEVIPQHLGAAGVAQLRHRLRLDLPDPLTGDPVDLADLVEGARLP